LQSFKESSVHLVVQAGSIPGDLSVRLTNPKRGQTDFYSPNNRQAVSEKANPRRKDEESLSRNTQGNQAGTK